MVEKIILHSSINLGFLTQNEICLADVLILEQTLASRQLFDFLSYSAIYLETSLSFSCFELRIASMGFKYGRIPAVSNTHLLEF